MERAINLIHRAEETRGYVHRKLVGVLIMVTSGTLLLLLVSISPLLVGLWSFANQLFRVFPGFVSFAERLNATLAPLWNYLALPLPFVLMWLVFLLVYFLAPARAFPLRSAMLGAIIASILWQFAKEAYGFYLFEFGRHDQLYGPAGVLVGLVLWIYYIYGRHPALGCRGRGGSLAKKFLWTVKGLAVASQYGKYRKVQSRSGGKRKAVAPHRVDGLDAMARTLASHFSGTTEADGNLTVLDDHGNLPHAVREF